MCAKIFKEGDYSRSEIVHIQRQLVKDSINWAECRNNSIDVNFHLQKVCEVLIKKSADKI